MTRGRRASDTVSREARIVTYAPVSSTWSMASSAGKLIGYVRESARGAFMD
jgi:hypothetical protein